MKILLLLILSFTLAGCAGWTVDAKLLKHGDDKCHVKKSKIKFCRRFDWPNQGSTS